MAREITKKSSNRRFSTTSRSYGRLAAAIPEVY
jgi:hypothetical protein